MERALKRIMLALHRDFDCWESEEEAAARRLTCEPVEGDVA